MTTTWLGSPQKDLDLLRCSPDELIDAVYSLKESFPHDLWDEVRRGFDVPSHELETSPLSSRIAWQAANHGALFAQHELRSPLPLPPHLGPEKESLEVSGWVDGALVEPRHFSFGQDHRIQSFHPNHRAQWRPHELAHALSGFFWHPQLTRFELYLSARLNELLPIIHWYGWDRICRPACPMHSKVETYREHCEDCAALARTPWWKSASNVPRDQDRFWASQGLEHFQREWQAIVQEYQSGMRVKTPRGPLDASSDAVGYLEGHWNRTTSWAFGRWVETFLSPGRDYQADFGQWLESHFMQHTGLFTSDLSFNQIETEERQWRRIVQEMGYRTLMALEHLPEESQAAQQCEDLLEPWLDASHQHLRVEVSSSCALIELSDTWFELLPNYRSLLPEDVGSRLSGLGLRALEKSINLRQLSQGLRSVEIECDNEDLLPFAKCESFSKEGFLVQRWTDFKPSSELADAAFFQAACGRDLDAEIFAALPDLEESVPLQELRLNTTAKWRQTANGEWDSAFSWQGEVRLITCSDAEYRWLHAPQAEGVPADLGTWLEMGLLVWLPAPQSRSQA